MQSGNVDVSILLKTQSPSPLQMQMQSLLSGGQPRQCGHNIVNFVSFDSTNNNDKNLFLKYVPYLRLSKRDLHFISYCSDPNSKPTKKGK